MAKNWEIYPRRSDDIIEQLLISRKIKRDEWSSFLNPDFNDLFDPFTMKGLKRAVERLEKAIEKNEAVGLFGDYDADGIPGTAILYEYLTKIGVKTEVFIPTREEGYGLSQKGIDVLKSCGIALLITIDLGIRNAKEIKYAKEKGLDVIVLDHHEVVGEKPDCIIVDPKQKGETYPFAELSAAAVVFKFIQGLNQKIKGVSENQLKWYVDLVGISVISDIVPLLSENRIFAKYGLIVLRKTKRLGLRELYSVAQINPHEIDTYTVGFQIGPRLNAPGRMDHANISFSLLTEKNSKKARILAEKLDRINKRRQAELERVLSEAKKEVCRNNLDSKKVIFISNENWPQGIVGLVAGKLMEEFARPVIVCEKKGEELKGSARSIDSYNIVEALDDAKDYLLKYGGHKKAAGLTLEYKHLSNLYDKLLEIAESKLRDEDLRPKIKIDAKLEKRDLTLALFDKIKKFEPFGLSNPRPVFLLEKAQISDIKTVGKEKKHLKFKADGISAIGFGLGDFAHKIDSAQADLVFTLDEDSWDGNRKLQLKILDLKV